MVNFKVLSNCNIIDVKSGDIFHDRDIWIENERIVKITSYNANLVSTDTIIDASGKYVIPSLWDMHAHVVNYDWVGKLYTASGVTGLRIMHGGPNELQKINNERKDGFYNGFEFLYSSPITDGPGESWPGSRIVSDPEQARNLVREYYEKGYDFVKVYNFLSYDTYHAIADECKKLDFPFVGHVPLDISTKDAISAGQKSIEHSIGLEHAIPNYEKFYKKYKDADYNAYLSAFLKEYESNLKDSVLKITKSDKTWFCPTLVNLKAYILNKETDSLFRNDPNLKYIPKEEQEYWFGDSTDEGTPSYLNVDPKMAELEQESFSLRMSYLKPMLDNGSRFLAGTDTSNPNIYPGFSLHQELELFVEAGFTELEALQTATLNPAIFIEREAELGSIEEDKIANILILDNNPLDNIRNTMSISGLIKRGDYLGKEQLKNLLDELLN